MTIFFGNADLGPHILQPFAVNSALNTRSIVFIFIGIAISRARMPSMLPSPAYAGKFLGTDPPSLLLHFHAYP